MSIWQAVEKKELDVIARSEATRRSRFSSQERDSSAFQPARLWKSLRPLLKSFTLEGYIDASRHLNIPITKGKVSFIRKVDSHGKIEVNGSTYFISRKLERQYVTATIFTHRKRLVVKQENKIMKSFSFPIKGHIVAPLLPMTRGKT